MGLLRSLFAFAAPPTSQQANGPAPIVSMIPIFIIFMVFYFLIIRPQQTKQRQHQEMIQRLSKNDIVVTTGGIYGTIVALKESTVMLRIDDNVKIEVERSSIVRVVKSRTKDAATQD
ncbi:MAG: preprotein translocase subunit YajC [Candidatus Omnitrophica bacterium]|nr:preprotein translocase subunit YajC [Candidatus Omnitrophota bacterium]